jgi:sphinganine-1-phosphate aldolase
MMGAVTADEDVIWQSGKVSGAIYHGEKAHLDLLNKAFSFYSIANPLHPDIWPSGMKYESEIIAMTAALVGLDDAKTAGLCGCTTSVRWLQLLLSL